MPPLSPSVRCKPAATILVTTGSYYETVGQNGGDCYRRLVTRTDDESLSLPPVCVINQR